MSAHTFTCNFGNGISCTATFSRPTGATLAVHDMEWTRKPTPQEYPMLAAQYRHWINGVREQLATQWGITMLAALCVEEGRTEMWKFVPNQPAELLHVAPFNLP